ncbi:hypothetical protein D3C84_912570 [compost metagenome]
MDTCDFRTLMSGEIGVQFDAQGLSVKMALQQAVDLGHLLAFKLDPAFFLKVIQRLDHPGTLGLVL